MDYERILFALEGGVARITLACPEKRNVLSRRLLAELDDALARCAAAQARVAVLAAQGGVFSGGGDLADPLTRARELGTLLEESYHPVLRRLLAVPCPVLCAVDGLAVGGACGLILACDMVLASERARFSFPFVDIGLVPDCGLAWLLPRIVGRVQARRLLLSGETIDGAQAQRLGLVSQLVEADALGPAVDALAARLAAGDPATRTACKDILAQAETRSLEEALACERTLQDAAGRSAAFAATLARLDRRDRD